jgi:DNA primase
MVKYLIKAKIEVDGIVDKHDIIGAIFGQTEGLFGEQFDLRELQDKGRIGRIVVNTRVQKGKTVGEIILPSNLDRLETALIAAMIETVDKVGPYKAKIRVEDIVDMRIEKIKQIVDRAVEILQSWSREKSPDLREILKEIQESLKMPQPQKYGPENLPAGPDVDKSDTLILVEGRADVINLLKSGVRNTIALGGARRIPETVKKLAAQKKIIAFLDGDHGGDLILKELLRTIPVDYVARAPPGKEVEELTDKEIKEQLSQAVPVREYLEKLAKHGNKEAEYLLQVQENLHKQYRQPPPPTAKPAPPQPKAKKVVEEEIRIPASVKDDIKSLYGTLEAILYDAGWKQIKRIPVRDLVTELESVEPGKIYAIVFDGIITQRLLDKASEKNVKLLIGLRLGKITSKPENTLILTFHDIM